ncbi:MAG: hypothetical protein HQM16_06095 [Deltaproteobacteria bacterium]|nr:hypothetical protein [Deltaproteobacteria bacterium]
MVIENNPDVDRHEERRLDEKKTENRRDNEKRLQNQPMRTFEAKLAEKTAHEITSKDSALRQAHDQKTSKKEQQSLLDKIIGTVKAKDTEKEKVKPDAVAKEVIEEYEEQGQRTKERFNAALKHLGHKDGRRLEEKSLEEKDMEEKALDEKALDEKALDEKALGEKDQLQRQEKAVEKVRSDKRDSDDDHVEDKDSKNSEQSAEGHKRVAEKTEEQGGGQSGGGQGGSYGDEKGQGGFGQQSGGQDREKHAALTLKGSFKDRVSGIKKMGGGSRGFQRDARDFASDNLDEIVTSVQLNVNEAGETEFSVELSDEYFEGLKVVATRTAGGVVLKFVCPNTQVLSTFLKFRTKVYERFMQKNISVLRIDVV